MSITLLAEEYFSTNTKIQQKIESLFKNLNEISCLETKRKIREKIISLERVLRQNIQTYHHLKYYYNKEVNCRAWM